MLLYLIAGFRVWESTVPPEVAALPLLCLMFLLLLLLLMSLPPPSPMSLMLRC